MTQIQKTAAFFDVDNTIIVGTNSLYLYIKYLVKNKMMSRYELFRGLWLSALHKFNLVDVEKVLDNFTLPYRGKSEQELIELTQRWFENTVVPHIAQEAVDKINWHKSQNHITVILSSASQYLCELIKNRLELDHTINTQVEVKDGYFTGYLKKPLCYHEGKVHYTKQYEKEMNIDLMQSYFYTDSISDLPMLKEVGYPIIINPDPLLKREAKKRGWEIEAWSTCTP